ncbi:protein-methionine-sulfoxide reductase heme-binding subunit MsrQ [Agarivorans sp. Z349TD_8]|uniref:protein-methionine-sulfoxide reductase heme-binding subunit MsrQ n=1 Tax=Agarivorans sp. Z349TD_8 TaxID=3421434 RepID=UPI003D7ECF82
MSKKINQYLAKHQWQVRVLLHLLLLSPLLYCFLALSDGWWGGDPVKPLIHYLANVALNILLITLCLAPFARRFRLPVLFAFRRLVGLYVFFYSLLHMLAYLVFDLGLDWALFGQEVLERPYIWFGMFAFILLLAQSLTSFKRIQQKLGRVWLQLHGFIYSVTLAIIIHFWWSLKSGWIEPIIYLGLTFVLLSMRRVPLRRWIKSFTPQN